MVVATGVTPRAATFDGADHPKVVSYADAISGAVEVGQRVAVVGAGGIGVDVSVFLTHTPDGPEDLDEWMAHWGVGDPALHPGGHHREEAADPRARGVAAAAQDHADRQGPREDVGLGAPRGAQGLGRAPRARA